jgi:hypothetical protein
MGSQAFRAINKLMKFYANTRSVSAATERIPPLGRDLPSMAGCGPPMTASPNSTNVGFCPGAFFGV